MKIGHWALAKQGMKKRQGRQGRGGRQGRDYSIIPPCLPCPPCLPAPCSLIPLIHEAYKQIEDLLIY